MSHRRLRRLAWRPETLTGLACVAVMAAGLHGPDFAAQDYRAWLVRQHGVLLWNSRWYGGHPILGYSVLFPPLAAVLGVAAVSALSCLASTACFSRLLGQSRAAHVATWWFAVSTVVDLIVGRGPFALGLATGLAALLAARTNRRAVAGLCALTCGLSSPLVGVLLLIAALAWFFEIGVRTTSPLCAAVSGPLAAFVGHESGPFPFPLPTFLGFLAFVGLGLLLLPATRITARRAIALYGVAGCVCFSVTNPVGGNIVRAAAVMGGPVAAWGLLEARRRTLLFALLPPLLLWQTAPVAAAVQGSRAPSANAAYYRPLLTYLRTHPEPVGRVEVPFTRDHWEARFVAAHAALARGWERQVDLARNAVLYQPLSAAAYRHWLDDNAVTLVARPDVPLDTGGVAEAALLEHPPSWLVPVFVSTHWTVWRVAQPTPVASAPAQLTELDIASLVLRFTRPGTSLVRVRWTSLWQTSSGADVERAPGDWTYVTSRRAGTVVIAARLPLPWLRGAIDHD